jgi:hypothetical protein
MRIGTFGKAGQKQRSGHVAARRSIETMLGIDKAENRTGNGIVGAGGGKVVKHESG